MADASPPTFSIDEELRGDELSPGPPGSNTTHPHNASKVELSPELLFFVFKETVEAFPQALHPVRFSSPLFAVSHVCRIWRKEVLGAKVLWTRFCIDDITSQTVDLLQTTLARSQGMDISFDVASRARSGTSPHQTLDHVRVFELLWHERNRWKEARILLDEKESRKEYQKWPLVDMPALSSLDFTSNVAVFDSEAGIGWRIDLEQATNLRTLCLNTPLRLNTDKLPSLTYLTNLSLSDRTASMDQRERIRNGVSILDFLRLTPNLVHFEFRYGNVVEGIGDAVFKPNDPSFKPLSFPHLRSIALYFNEVSDSSAFINYFHVPNLRYFVLDGIFSDPETIEQVRRLLARWQPPLVHLQLGDMSITVTQLFEVLRNVPTVEELIFFARTSFHLAFLKELSGEIPSPVDLAETENDDPPSTNALASRPTRPCPNLRLLIFRGRFWGQPYAPLSDAAEADLSLAIAALSHLAILEELHSENELIAHVPVDVRAELEGSLVEGITLKTYLPGECPVRVLCNCDEVKTAFDVRFSGE